MCKIEIYREKKRERERKGGEIIYILRKIETKRNRQVYSWYHRLSLFFIINSRALEENCSASFIILAVRSSRLLSFSPRSTANWWALDISLAAVLARLPNASSWADGPGTSLATSFGALPLVDSPTIWKHT